MFCPALVCSALLENEELTPSPPLSPPQLDAGNGLEINKVQGPIGAWTKRDVKEISEKTSVDKIADKIEKETGIVPARIKLAGAGAAFDATVWERAGGNGGGLGWGRE